MDLNVDILLELKERRTANFPLEVRKKLLLSLVQI
jgi:hypothetical protein